MFGARYQLHVIDQLHVLKNHPSVSGQVKNQSLAFLIAGIVDTKTERAWKESHDAFRGQALGQFVGCTLLSGRSGVGFPVLLTNLVGNSHVFHGVQEEGGGFVQEVVFSNQAAAFQYFGKVCSQAEVVRRKKVTELLAALDNRPPRLPAPQPSSPFRNPLDSPQSHGPVDSDLRECAYREVRREQPLFNLPPFEIMMEYLSNLEQGVARAAEIRSRPSYII
ncbi:hypothetical protein KFL_014360010 [Klebsormidium nitens]|uniref:Uncharacterized protein n=1 Tax=Klebsormidium nitens TaxID=105231 RepID=A0A1Y1IWN1_KLENI|nr:hypothetical protein KFL_014360010 [Klebsormidium nitens]|eukprot:GAQ93316.1 hypothetical protein KFL_014360010 [Klebsormidium nitens]